MALLSALVLPASPASRAEDTAAELRGRTRSLRVAACSVEQEPRNTEKNLEHIETWARRAAKAGADLVLFPEAAISGWWQSREIRKYGEPVDGPSIRRLIRLANELGLALAVGMTEVDGDNAYLTHVLLDGKGVIGKHRKSSLAGGETGERTVWDAGADANVLTYRNIKIGIAICYESVHPETCRELKARGAEIILAPYANGTRPDELLDIELGREHGKRTYTYARATENEVWYVACDYAPRGTKGETQTGAAYVIDPGGRLVALSDRTRPGETMVVVTIEIPAKPERE